MLVITGTKIMVIKVGMMKILEEVMDLIIEVIGKELIIKGEMVGLALGVFGAFYSLVVVRYGSPKKEKMIWSCLGERSLRWGE